jgi:hypothetical protein
VVSLRSTEALQLVDLRGDGPIRIAAPTAVAHDTNHAAGRALSSATHADVPEADGFLFQSRFTGHLCVAVFDRAIGKLEASGVVPLIEHADFLEAIKDYAITLLNPAGMNQCKGLVDPVSVVRQMTAAWFRSTRTTCSRSATR